MVRSIVVKFGGSVLRDISAISEAAKWVKEMLSRGVGVVVVVSAMKGVTDELQEAAENLSSNPDPKLMAEILSMGERMSVRLFALALRDHGINAIFIDPSSENWPIIADGNPLDANPIYELVKKKVLERIEPMVERGVVPVICGFIGINKNGEIVTLGRGGSDTTAVLLGSCLRSDEIVLVKDVPGVFSADPGIVDDAELLSTLNFREAQALIRGGSKIIHTKALRYLDRGLRLRIASFEELLKGGGTIIEGCEKELDVKIFEERISMVTIVGSNSPGSLGRLTEVLMRNGVKVVASSSEENSIILYVIEVKNILKKLHKMLLTEKIGKALSIYQGLSMITVTGRMLETSPGIIYRIVKPLAEEGINVYGLVTISSSIRIFVSEKDSEKASDLIMKALEGVSG